MIRFLITFTVLLIHHQAYAGWTELMADNIATEYVNYETIEQENNIVLMWNMSDFQSKQKVGNGRLYQSTKALQEYNCLLQSKRIISLIHFVEAKGKGAIAFFNKQPTEWKKVQSNTLGYVLLHAACRQ